MRQHHFFSIPHNPIVGQWHEYGPKINQAALTTAREKSVYRLGLISSTPTLLEKGILTEADIEQMNEDCIKLENSHTITGFYQNLLLSGIK